jgi:hypothetical protein
VTIEVTDIAGAHQAVDRLLGPAVGVALEHQRAAHEHTASNALRELPALVVEDLDRHAGCGSADGPRGGAQVGWRGDRAGADLRRGVAVVEHVTELVHQRLRQLGRERGGTADQHPQRRAVVAPARRRRQVHDPLQHRGNGEERGGIVTLDLDHYALRVEPPQCQQRPRTGAASRPKPSAPAPGDPAARRLESGLVQREYSASTASSGSWASPVAADPSRAHIGAIVRGRWTIAAASSLLIAGT